MGWSDADSEIRVQDGTFCPQIAWMQKRENIVRMMLFEDGCIKFSETRRLHYKVLSKDLTPKQ
jgi:hypothetical protein